MLDPLKFAIAIQDQTKEDLKKIQERLAKLKDQTINIKIDGISDLRQLMQMLGQQTAPKIGEKVSQEMDEAKGKVKSLEQEIQTLQQAMQRMPKDNIALQSHLKEINSCIQANREFRKELANPQGLDSNYLSQLPNAIQHNIGVIKTELEKLKVLSRGSGFDQSWLTTIQRRVDAENELISVQQRSSQSSQQQTQNVKQVGDAAQTTSEQLQKLAQSAIKGSFTQFIHDLEEVKTHIKNDNFTAFSRRIEACAENVNKLDEAFRKFKVTIGEDNNLKELLTGWGAAIKEVSASIRMMDSIKNGSGTKKSNPAEELKQQEQGIVKVGNAIERLKGMASSGGTGENFIERLDKTGLRNIQTLIKEQDHIRRLIELAKKSIDFGEGHPVMGMGRLRGDQMSNLKELKERAELIKEILYQANNGNPNKIGYLNKLGSLKLEAYKMDKMGNSVTLLGGHYDALKHSVTGTASAMRQLYNEMRLDFNKVANKEKLAAEAEAVKKLASSYKSMQQESKTMRSQSESALASRIKMLREQSADLQKLLSVGKIGLGDSQYNSVRDALRETRRELQQIETITQRGGNSTGLLRSLSVGRDYSGVIASGRAVADMRNKQAQETNLASRAVSQLTMEEQRLAQALNQATNSARGQSQVLGDLKSLATQYLGVWGAQQFVRNIIEIGGQLEKQRLSLGAILGDTAQANELFDNIKNLAIKSPFGVVELDQFSKQLSAYGFKSNELFDMTKRLADIAAGAGTEVSRLALALGHVRSEGALSGYTLRQFAMNNIPMLQKLSERLTQIEGKIVSTAEIRKRVSKKQIGYEDVVAVIKDLTDEGGMFYNMQETISESVQARFKNLKDSMDIMYGEMAKGGIGDILKLIASGLTSLTREWKVVLPIIASATAYFGFQKLAMAGVNAQITTYGVSVKALRGATYKLTAEEVKNLAVTKQLNRQQLIIAVATRRLTVEQAELAGATMGLTKAQLQQIAMSGRIDKAMIGNAISTSKYTVAQLRAMAGAKVSGFGALNGALTRMKLGWMGATAGAKAFRASLKAMTASIGWLLAIESVITLISSQYQKLQAERERKSEMKNKAVEGYRNMSQNAVNFKVGISADLSESELKTQIDAMMQELKEYSPQVGNVLKDAFKVDNGASVNSLAEQYEILAKEIDATKKAYAELEEISDEFEKSNNKTGGRWYQFGLNDSMRKNIKDYAEEVQNLKNTESEFLKNRSKIDIALKQTRDIFGDYRDAVQKNIETYSKSNGKEGFAETDIAAQIKLLDQYQKAYASFEAKMGGSAFASPWTNYKRAIIEYDSAYKRFTDDADTYTKDLVKKLEGRYGKSVSQFNEYQKRAVQIGIQTFLKGIEGFTDLAKEERRKIENELLKPFGIKIDVEVEEAYNQLSKFQQYLEKLTSKTWKVEIKQVTSISDVTEAAKKDRKQNKQTFKDTRGILKKGNVSEKKLQALATALYREGRTTLNTEGANEAESLIYMPFAQGTLPKQQGKTAGQRAADDFIDSLNNENTKKAARDYIEAYASELNNKTLEKEGYDLSDNKKSGRSNHEDREAKRLREIAKLYKDAYDWYKKYANQVGEGSALEKVKKQFQPLFDEFNKEWKTNLSLDSIPNYKGNLGGLLDEGMSLYKTKTHRNNFMVDAIKLIRDAINDVDFTEAQRKMDEFASDTKEQLDEITRKWEIFNSLLTTTGDASLAERLTGIAPGATVADLKRAKISGYAGVPIDFNSILGMGDKDIDKYVTELGVSEDKIKAIQNDLKDWKKAQEDLTKSDIQNYAKWLGGLVDITSIQSRNQREYNAALEETNRLLAAGKITQEEADRRKNAAQAQMETKNWQATSMYSNLYNRSQQMAASEFATAYQNELDSLNSQLSTGAITIEQYTEKVANLNKIATEFDQSGFLGIKGGVGAFLAGGQQGLIDYYRGKASILRGKGDEGGAKAEEEKANSLEKMQKKAEQVATVFDRLSKVSNMLGDMFDALGMEGAANAFSDAGAVMGGAVSGAQSLSFAGPWGMAAGAAIGGITSIAQVHDKSLERQINKLREEVTKIENNTALIVQARQRTLGFDNGDVRRSFAQQYADYNNKFSRTIDIMKGKSVTVEFDDKAKKAMYEYYGRNDEGSGYVQEYKNLQKEHESYMQILDKQMSKKKKSNSDIEATKKKIAELDDQIRYFTLDLAKDLFDIDVKGWADQLSDALASAFENGESMAKSYRDTVTGILQQVGNKMLKMKILQPMFESLEDRISGLLDPNNVEGSMPKLIETIGEFFGRGGEGEKAIGASTQFMTAYQEMLKKYGLDVKSETAKTLSSSAQGTSEETSDLLAGYINAARQDIAANRIMLAQYITQFWPEYIEQFRHSVTSLGNIDNNTRIVMEMMRDGRGAMYNEIAALRSRFDNVVNGIESLSMK